MSLLSRGFFTVTVMMCGKISNNFVGADEIQCFLSFPKEGFGALLPNAG